MPTWVSDLKDALQIISLAVAIIGFPIALSRYSEEKRKDRLLREKEAFAVSNQRYVEYLHLCLQYPELDGFDLAKADARITHAGTEYRKLILFSALTAMLETAYLYYEESPTQFLGEPWGAWDRYLRLWASRRDYCDAWPLIRGQFHDQFARYMDRLVAECWPSKATMAPISCPGDGDVGAPA